MTARKLAAAAAAGLTAAMLLTGASTAVASASTPKAVPDGYGYWTDFPGSGSTLANAEASALQLSADYGCSSRGTLVSSSESGGVWSVLMKTYCPYGT